MKTRLVSAAILAAGLVTAAPARAVPCFATDGDGVYDTDGLVNGVITVTSTSTSAVLPAPTPYDCTAVDVVVQAGGFLVLQGDPASGEIAALEVGSLTIGTGGAIRADQQGCPSFFAGPSGAGAAPNEANVCTTGAVGAGGQGNDFGGSGGGGHGGAGGNGAVGAGGTPYDSATLPVLFGASGGNTGGAAAGGGPGGGVVRINVVGTLAHDGEITAHGANGGGSGGRVTGGGAGGSILVSAATVNGTGSFRAHGGNGVNTAGGGGGGRVALLYDGGTFSFDAGDFDVAGGTGGGSNGAKGTVYLRDATTSTVRIFHGFTFTDIDHVETTWLADASATNQYCDPTIVPTATPSITAETVTLGGAIACTPLIASFIVTETGAGGALSVPSGSTVSVNGGLTLSAATTLALGDGASLANTRRGTDLTLDVPDGDAQGWTGVVVDGAAEGRVVIDAAIALTLAAGSTVRGNPAWPNLTGLAIDATSAIDANGKGCDARFAGPGGAGAAPNGANVCTTGAVGAGGEGNDFGGSAGGGHGGTGGNGGIGTGGATYDSEIDPRLFGASGGNTGGTTAGGGPGGGLVEIGVSGTLTHDGGISARGGAGGGSGGRVTGGGAGGSINVTATTYACTTGGTFDVGGGAGMATTGGGGGGGRVLVNVPADTCATAPLVALDPAVVAAGGPSGGAAVDGGSGTVSFGSVPTTTTMSTSTVTTTTLATTTTTLPTTTTTLPTTTTTSTTTVTSTTTTTTLAGGLVPGGPATKSSSDCYLELLVVGVENASPQVEDGKKIFCTDGEACDTGPCGDNVCAMRAAACINQTDPTLSDCTPPAMLEKANVKNRISISVPQLLEGPSCSPLVDFEITATFNGKGKYQAKKSKQSIKGKAKAPKGTSPRSDSDKWTIQCLPRTVECPGSASGAFVD